MNSVNYFNTIADKWDVMREGYFKDELKYKAFKEAEIEGKVITDLGCGSGFISMALLDKAKIVFSLDSSINMLKILTKEAKKKGYNNLYGIKADLEDIPLFDESIDVIFVNMALHHVGNPSKSIGEMHRVLKPKGILIITDVMEHKGEWAREEMYDKWLGFKEEEILSWFKSSKFRESKYENTGLTCKGYSSKGEFLETGIFLAKGIK